MSKEYNDGVRKTLEDPPWRDGEYFPDTEVNEGDWYEDEGEGVAELAMWAAADRTELTDRATIIIDGEFEIDLTDQLVAQIIWDVAKGPPKLSGIYQGMYQWEFERGSDRLAVFHRLTVDGKDILLRDWASIRRGFAKVKEGQEVVVLYKGEGRSRKGFSYHNILVGRKI